MFAKDTLFEKIQEAIAPLLEERGVELVEMTYGWRGADNVLQILVDTVGGIHVDECAFLNNRISEILDRLSLIEENHLLEVASPGLDRPLTTERDFARAKGKDIRVFLKSPLFYRMEYEGTLEDLKGGILFLRLSEGTVLEIPLEQIGKGKRLIHF